MIAAGIADEPPAGSRPHSPRKLRRDKAIAEGFTQPEVYSARALLKVGVEAISHEITRLRDNAIRGKLASIEVRDLNEYMRTLILVSREERADELIADVSSSAPTEENMKLLGQAIKYISSRNTTTKLTDISVR